MKQLKDQMVAKTGDTMTVSTVLLPDGMSYETMVFRRCSTAKPTVLGWEIDCRRYQTESLATIGHALMVESVRITYC